MQQPMASSQTIASCGEALRATRSIPESHLMHDCQNNKQDENKACYRQSSDPSLSKRFGENLSCLGARALRYDGLADVDVRWHVARDLYVQDQGGEQFRLQYRAESDWNGGSFVLPACPFFPVECHRNAPCYISMRSSGRSLQL